MLDILAYGTNHDSCVVLPTLDHAVYWWPRIQQMFMERKNQHPIQTKTAIVLRGSRTAVRLLVPYEREPTMATEFDYEFVHECDYLCLYGLADRRSIKWV